MSEQRAEAIAANAFALTALHYYDLVYRPGTAIVLADTLSRAYQPALTNGSVPDMRFCEELAACSENEPLCDLKLVASASTIDRLLIDYALLHKAMTCMACLLHRLRPGGRPTPHC